MTMPNRSLILAALAVLALAATAMLPHPAFEVAEVGAASPEAPPLHVSVPTQPFHTPQ